MSSAYAMTHDEYAAAQQTALATLVQENKSLIISSITGWLGLGGPWGAVASFLLGQLIDQCSDVDAKNRAFESQLRQSIATNLGNLPPIQPRPCPEGVELIPNRVEVRATEIGQPIAVPLVIACDQDVTVNFELVGHAASPCHQDLALVWIVGSRGGQGTVVWSKSAKGIARVFNPESVRVAGQERVRLQAGGYALIAAFTGDNSAASASVEYASVPAPPPVWQQPWAKAALAGVGAGALAALAATFLVRG